MIKCIIVDDERMTLNELRNLAVQCGVDVCGAYQNPKKALAHIDEINPDVAFLDIEMPEINGIELAKKLHELGIKTVFITAYKEHAVKAFGVSAVHYLLKPVKKEDLKEAVNRVSEAKKLETGLGEANSISFIKGSSGVSDKISIQESDDISVIKIIDILYIYAHSGNTIITTKFGTYKSRKGLQFWEERLNENGFLRCHKSYLINTEYISKMIHVLGEYKELELCYGDVHIPISRRKVKEVKDWMGVV